MSLQTFCFRLIQNVGRRKSDREEIQSVDSQLRQSILVSGLEKETSSIVSVVFPSFSTVKWDLGQRGSGSSACHLIEPGRLGTWGRYQMPYCTTETFRVKAAKFENKLSLIFVSSLSYPWPFSFFFFFFSFHLFLLVGG